MFRTKHQKLEREIYSNAGERYHTTYSLQLDENGVWDLVPTGKVDVVEEIQSHAESVDIHNILARFANGDESVLVQRVGDYFDATELPANLAEMYRFVQNGEEAFNRLPVEKRAEFDHSFSRFVSEIGSQHFVDVFLSKNETVAEAVQEVAHES